MQASTKRLVLTWVSVLYVIVAFIVLKPVVEGRPEAEELQPAVIILKGNKIRLNVREGLAGEALKDLSFMSSFVEEDVALPPGQGLALIVDGHAISVYAEKAIAGQIVIQGMDDNDRFETLQ